jgi:uncharacterized membrane protein
MSASLGVRLRRYWIAGLLVLAPTVLTLWVVWKLFTFFDDILGSQLRARGISVVGLGFVLLNLLLLMMGFIAANIAGKRLFALWDRIMNRVPLINKIYATLRQIAELLLGSSCPASFGRVAIVEFPSPGSWGLGFVTAKVPGGVGTSGSPHCSLFIPSAVNPTTGILLVIPEERVTYLDLTPEQAMKMIVSAGALAPPLRPST